MANDNGISESFEVWRARFEERFNNRLARHEEVMRQQEEQISAQTTCIGHVTTQIEGAILPTQRELADRMKRQEEQLDEQGVTVDHLVNTMDTIVLPTQQQQGQKIAEHSEGNREAHDYIMSQRGAWAFVQKAGIVIAAATGIAGLVLKLKGM